MNHPQPSVEWLGIRIDEPVTTFTDLLVSLVCFYAFYKLNRIALKHKVHWNLKYYFLSMGIATLVGGLIGHGFLYLFSFAWKLPGWLTSMFSIALLERASIMFAKPLIKPSVGNFFAWMNLIELATFVIVTFYTLNFFFVEVHSAYGLLVIVTSFNLFVYYKTKNQASKTFLIAVAISSVSALIFMNEIGIGPWFNHYDISHTLMACSAYVFYRGSLKMINDPLAYGQRS
ncbi:MAG: hypothetical protein HC819_10335 [Cyclobacteriaceae bacterium]|nr:hypothetical protein [Cyclobacteriaceae bacterium]